MAADFQPLPPRAAIAALQARGQNLRPSFAWQDVYASLHADMFTVAKSAGHDILDEIFEALLKALEEGSTFEDFADELEPLLRQRGWWGRTTAIDPLTGQNQIVQLGSARRLRTIFDVNMRVSYATGHWNAFEANKDVRPFLRYVAILDDRTRDEHRAMHNLVLPVDHPFWQTFAPPNGWNCRCTLQSLSQRDVDRLIAEGEQLQFEPPDFGTREWLNKRTGETREIPNGIDPGWDYNPGQAGHKVITRRLEAERDL
ncbi:MAG: phage minor head protein [Pseudomonadota bacterium]